MNSATSDALNAARNLLKRVYATIGAVYDGQLNAGETPDDRLSNAMGKVEAAFTDFDAVRFNPTHRYSTADMVDAISCHQYRDDAKHGGHYIPDCNVDHYGNLAARAILAAATLVEMAPEA